MEKGLWFCNKTCFFFRPWLLKFNHVSTSISSTLAYVGKIVDSPPLLVGRDDPSKNKKILRENYKINSSHVNGI
jgi:hypothetical protein